MCSVSSGEGHERRRGGRARLRTVKHRSGISIGRKRDLRRPPQRAQKYFSRVRRKHERLAKPEPLA